MESASVVDPEIFRAGVRYPSARRTLVKARLIPTVIRLVIEKGHGGRGRMMKGPGSEPIPGIDTVIVLQDAEQLCMMLGHLPRLFEKCLGRHRKKFGGIGRTVVIHQ